MSCDVSRRAISADTSGGRPTERGDECAHVTPSCTCVTRVPSSELYALYNPSFRIADYDTFDFRTSGFRPTPYDDGTRPSPGRFVTGRSALHRHSTRARSPARLRLAQPTTRTQDQHAPCSLRGTASTLRSAPSSRLARPRAPSAVAPVHVQLYTTLHSARSTRCLRHTVEPDRRPSLS